MGSLYLWGRSIQEMGGDVVIGCSIYGVVVIDGSLCSRFYGSWVSLRSTRHITRVLIACRTLVNPFGTLHVIFTATFLYYFKLLFLSTFSCQFSQFCFSIFFLQASQQCLVFFLPHQHIVMLHIIPQTLSLLGFLSPTLQPFP